MYIIIKRLIDKGRTDGLAEKAGKLYLYGQLTDAEYEEIMALLQPAGSAVEA